MTGLVLVSFAEELSEVIPNFGTL